MPANLSAFFSISGALKLHSLFRRMDYTELSKPTKYAIWLFEHHFRTTPSFSVLNELERCSCEDEFYEKFKAELLEIIANCQEICNLIN
jgi:hypothetical protein